MTIKVGCGECGRLVKAKDDLAGKRVKCPHCGGRIVVPGGQDTPSDQKGLSPEERKAEVARGRRIVLIIASVVVGMRLLSVGTHFAMPDPEDVGRIVVKDVAARAANNDRLWLYQNEKIQKMAGEEARDHYTIQQMVHLIWMVGSFLVSAILLLFLCFRSGIARVLLGVFLILEGTLVVVSLVMATVKGEITILRLLPPHAMLLAILEAMVKMGVTIGVGIALFRSNAISAYTRK